MGRYENYFTGPIQHDLGFELIFGSLTLLLLFIIWKIFKMEWPNL